MISLLEFQTKCCERKARFPSETRAERSAQKWCDADGAARTLYRCPVCDGWHISSKLLVGYTGYALPSSVVFPKHESTAALNVMQKGRV